MGVTVGVNTMSVVHQDSSGISLSFPDVCQMPTPVGPIPVPLPNIARSQDTAQGTKKVTCDGNAVCIDGSSFSASTAPIESPAMARFSSSAA